jgi:CDP-6-deoxy-D-xylo-4-hexulose-3-dehydrase
VNSEVEQLASQLAKLAISQFHLPKAFIPGESQIPVTGKVFGEAEIYAAAMASAKFWLTSGEYTEIFEKSLSQKIGVRHALMVNSGSSANLLALSSLCSPSLGEQALKPGDEVVTVAAGFPTTVTPILQNRLVPVYVDVDLGSYVANTHELEASIGPKTRAIMMAHTLGNPFDLRKVREIAEKHSLWVVEDSCDALGGTYEGKQLGSFGDLSTLSFYPAHHITTGEGGAVLIKNAYLKPIVESFRDWGRSCWCAPGCDNTCAKRYGWKLGELPQGYDHKYTYSHLGFNLKSGDIQAAIGIEQLNRLDTFVEIRKRNWLRLHERLSDLEEYLLLPKVTPNADPSWFGFAMTVKDNSPVTRDKLISHLNSVGIATRLLFAGNLLRQPAFLGTPRRVHSSLVNTDKVMNDTFWIGVWPGLTENMVDFMADTLLKCFGKKID